MKKTQIFGPGSGWRWYQSSFIRTLPSALESHQFCYLSSSWARAFAHHHRLGITNRLIHPTLKIEFNELLTALYRFAKPKATHTHPKMVMSKPAIIVMIGAPEVIR